MVKLAVISLCLFLGLTVVADAQLRAAGSSAHRRAQYSVGLGWGVGQGAASQGKPNVILLLTDDQDVMLGGLDEMPILKRLLQERGTTFRNAFVHTPICCSSRMSIMSGRYLQNLNNGNPVNNSYSGGCHGPVWRNDAEQKTFAVYAKVRSVFDRHLLFALVSVLTIHSLLYTLTNKGGRI
jgi:hypothetical protein